MSVKAPYDVPIISLRVVGRIAGAIEGGLVAFIERAADVAERWAARNVITYDQL
jgi:hypothetical protein